MGVGEIIIIIIVIKIETIRQEETKVEAEVGAEVGKKILKNNQ